MFTLWQLGFFYGNIESAYKTLKDGKYILRAVVKGQLNERLHAVNPQIWHELIHFAYEKAQLLNFNKEFIKVNMVTISEGQPFEVILSPGKYHDNDPFKLMSLQLPKESSLYGDSAYTDYNYEDKLKKRVIRVVIERKENSTRHHDFEDWKDLKFYRRKIETTFSRIAAFLPKKIHPVTDAGFELKVMGFIIALSLNFIIN